MAHYENNKGMTDEWYTPKYVFDALGCTFDTDAASPIDRTFCCVPASVFLTERSLQTEWEGFTWVNPPFGSRNSKGMWLDKMYHHGNGICLTPDRTSAPWWQKAAKECNSHLQVNGKIKFIGADGIEGKWPGNGTTLFGYGEHATRVLLNAQKKGLGLLFINI